ncbi:DUF86 domain-containing protein [bacterium]|nr:DUF86 domain-containing protein [bacterium]
MSKHDDGSSLRDMLNYAKEAIELLGDTSREDFGRNRMMQLALTRLVEVLGESTNRVSYETQQKTPEIPWLQIVGMRNRLIHGYDVIDYDLLWDTVTIDLPPLIKTLENITKD